MRLLVVVAPFLVGWVAAVAFEWWLSRPVWMTHWAWMLLTLAVATGAAVVTGRLVQRALPLAALLQVSLGFPDRAPSRVLTALRSGSVRSLERMLIDPAPPPDATTAAVRALTLVGALGRHDRLTRGHCERVRGYADLMARQLDLSTEDAERLRWVALLHDIGKVQVPSAVLNKRGKLDEDEWQAIRRHPSNGAALIVGLEDWLGPWAKSIEQHHERVDGTGYPARLPAEEICLGARVIAVIDVFDVMTASRSYKRPITSGEARRELKRCAGTQFDPDVVESFLAVSEPRRSWLAGVLAGLSRTAHLGGGAPGSATSGVSTLPAVTVGTVARAAIAVGALTLAATGTPLPAAAATSTTQLSARSGRAPTSAVSRPETHTSAAPPGTASSGPPGPAAADGTSLSGPAGTSVETSGSTTTTALSSASSPSAGPGTQPRSTPISLPPVATPPIAVPPVTILGISVPPVTVPSIGVPPVTVPPALRFLLPPHR